jgi:hypothetical protein
MAPGRPATQLPRAPAVAGAGDIVPFSLSEIVWIAIIVAVPATVTWLVGL